jgi:hypothetical protein
MSERLEYLEEWMDKVERELGAELADTQDTPEPDEAEDMSVYLLGPLPGQEDNPAMLSSSYIGPVYIQAPDEAHARELAAWLFGRQPCREPVRLRTQDPSVAFREAIKAVFPRIVDVEITRVAYGRFDVRFIFEVAEGVTHAIRVLVASHRDFPVLSEPLVAVLFQVFGAMSEEIE